MNTQFIAPTVIIVMLSLGLTLTVSDFKRAARIPVPLCAALLCQLILLPVLCFAITRVFALPPDLAIGLMLMAACPGGATANILSHLADGDLALNLTLTAINAVLSIVTLPVIVGVSIFLIAGQTHSIPLQYTKVLQTFAFVLLPVALGMLARHYFPAAAQQLQKPVKFIAAFFVLAVGTLAVVTGWKSLTEHFAALGASVLSLGCISLLVGYAVPRLLRLARPQAIAISIEIGLHNGALAIAIASSPQLLGNADMAVPGALYAILMPFVAGAFIVLVNSLHKQREPVAL
jgi:BASS family bile acid:Na+ symporter